MPEAISPIHSCEHTERDTQANLTSAREQLAAVKPSASAQRSAGFEMFSDVLVF